MSSVQFNLTRKGHVNALRLAGPCFEHRIVSSVPIKARALNSQVAYISIKYVGEKMVFSDSYYKAKLKSAFLRELEFEGELDQFPNFSECKCLERVTFRITRLTQMRTTLPPSVTHIVMDMPLSITRWPGINHAQIYNLKRITVPGRDGMPAGNFVVKDNQLVLVDAHEPEALRMGDYPSFEDESQLSADLAWLDSEPLTQEWAPELESLIGTEMDWLDSEPLTQEWGPSDDMPLMFAQAPQPTAEAVDALSVMFSDPSFSQESMEELTESFVRPNKRRRDAFEWDDFTLGVKIPRSGDWDFT